MSGGSLGYPRPHFIAGRNATYRWKERYGGLMPSEVRKLKHLEEENARLRRLVSDLSLDKKMLQEVLRKKA
jgi:putative transposase